MRHPIGHPTKIEHSEKTENQRFVKLKEVQADTQSQRFCTTFNFTPTHQAHPPPQHLTSAFSFDFIGNNSCKKTNFAY